MAETAAAMPWERVSSFWQSKTCTAVTLAWRRQLCPLGWRGERKLNDAVRIHQATSGKPDHYLFRGGQNFGQPSAWFAGRAAHGDRLYARGAGHQPACG